MKKAIFAIAVVVLLAFMSSIAFADEAPVKKGSKEAALQASVWFYNYIQKNPDITTDGHLWFLFGRYGFFVSDQGELVIEAGLHGTHPNNATSTTGGQAEIGYIHNFVSPGKTNFPYLGATVGKYWNSGNNYTISPTTASAFVGYRIFTTSSMSVNLEARYRKVFEETIPNTSSTWESNFLTFGIGVSSYF